MQEELDPGLRATRLITFITFTFGYGCTYLTRNSLSYAAPCMLKDSSLHLTLPLVGGLATILPLAYGTSNLVSGVLGARASPAYLLATALIVTGLCNILFSFGHHYLYFAACWLVNGLLQGLGSPACGRLLNSWFTSEESGLMWGIWAAGQNVGGAVVPLMVGNVAQRAGWRAAMQAPGCIAVMVGLLQPLLITDSPAAALASRSKQQGGRSTCVVGNPHQAPVKLPSDATPGSALDSPLLGSDSEQGLAEQQVENSPLQLLVRHCVCSWKVWVLAAQYFSVYVIRQSCTSWFIFFLMESKGIEDIQDAAWRVSGVEIFGLLGSLASGALSDWLVRRFRQAGIVGMRMVVTIGYAVWTAGSLAVLWHLPGTGSAFAQFLACGAIGFGLYGPQNMIALATAEFVEPDAVGPSQGFIGFLAYMGAAGAGTPIALLVQHLGWDAFFVALLVSTGVLAVLAACLAGAQSSAQRLASSSASALVDMTSEHAADLEVYPRTLSMP